MWSKGISSRSRSAISSPSPGRLGDRSAQARRVLERDGLVFLDRFGQPRPRPEVAIEKDAKLLFARLTRELQLDAGSLPEWFSRLKVVE